MVGIYKQKNLGDGIKCIYFYKQLIKVINHNIFKLVNKIGGLFFILYFNLFHNIKSVLSNNFKLNKKCIKY